jgi:hypothetical protein
VDEQRQGLGAVVEIADRSAGLVLQGREGSPFVDDQLILCKRGDGDEKDREENVRAHDVISDS